mgnify:CR=1 FL=1
MTEYKSDLEIARLADKQKITIDVQAREKK